MFHVKQNQIAAVLDRWYLMCLRVKSEVHCEMRQTSHHRESEERREDDSVLLGVPLFLGCEKYSQLQK